MSERFELHEGDCLEVMRRMGDGCVTSVVTDPPYGLSFMGKEWDHGVPGEAFWREALRVTKPGGMLFAFGGTRTYHRLVCAIEDAGWEIADCLALHWVYGSGFPKSHNISKAIDKARGAECVIGTQADRWTGKGSSLNFSTDRAQEECKVTVPATELAAKWDGYGTALKPAWEPIVMARKACEGSYAANAAQHGVAGLNIDAGRIEGAKPDTTRGAGGRIGRYGPIGAQGTIVDDGAGRWPANVMFEEGAAAMLDEQSGERMAGRPVPSVTASAPSKNAYGEMRRVGFEGYSDSGGASRFFYRAKARPGEREAGLREAGLREAEVRTGCGGEMPIDDNGNERDRFSKTARNTHPTVKPKAIMADVLGYLAGLLTMPEDATVILDPFMGSGTTGIACMERGVRFVGIEREAMYLEIARARIEHAARTAVHQGDLFGEAVG